MSLSRDIEEANAIDHARDEMTIKLLLLGAGQSGKSTIFKQMKLLYGKGFSDDDRRAWIPKIHTNTVSAMRDLCGAVFKLGMEHHVLKQDALKNLCEISDRAVLTPKLAMSMKLLWADPGVQRVWERRNEYQVIESNELYFHRIDHIVSSSYLPTDEDILASRVRTCGIVKETYVIEGAKNTGEITLNGPAARKVQKGDIIIIISYASMNVDAAKAFRPTLIFPDTATNTLV